MQCVCVECGLMTMRGGPGCSGHKFQCSNTTRCTLCLFVFTLTLRLYTHMHVACGAETKLMSFCGLLMPQGGATSASKLWASSSSRI